MTDHTVAGARGDLDLDPSLWERAGVAATRPAAVLVGVVDRAEPTVLLTLRNAALESHAGQIAFPGGKIEASDASPAAAALREAEEEIGLARGLVEPIGHLDLYLTFSGFRILPTVARVDPGHRLTLNHAEVDEAFEVPLAFLMDAQNHALHSRDWNGVIRALLRHAVRRALHLGRDCRYPAQPLRTNLSRLTSEPGNCPHDPSGLHRGGAVPDPVRGLRGLSVGDTRGRARSLRMVAGARWHGC